VKRNKKNSMKNLKEKSSCKPNKFIDGLNIIRVLHMLFNFLPNILFFGLFGFHDDYLDKTIYKPFAWEITIDLIKKQ
jgi:hypothetical protein